MNIDEIPTPESDAAYKKRLLESDKSHRIRMGQKMGSLERRLTIAREGFKDLIDAVEHGDFSNGEYSLFEMYSAKKALKLTAPNQ